MLTEKRCPKCDIVKDATQFYVSKTRPDGFSSYCRRCQVIDAKSRYSPHPRWKAPEGMKWCPKCKDTLPVENFGSNRRTHDGKQQYCKPCSVATVTASRHKDPTSHRASSKRWRENNLERHADNNAKHKYGLAHGSYAQMFEAQEGKCAICETPPVGERRLHIDHCHKTGTIRGLLCSGCNTGIGQLRHDMTILTSAINYLTKGRSESTG